MLRAHIFMSIFAAMLVWMPKQAFAQAQYPESALRDAFEQQAAEQTRAEELERKAAQKRSEYEKRVQQVEQQIAAKKIQTENYKIKSEELSNEIEAMNTDLFELKLKRNQTNNEIKYNEEKFQKIQAQYDATKKDFAELKTNLAKKESELSDLRKKLETTITKYKVETEEMRRDGAVIEAEVAAADAKRAELESVAMEAQVQWLSVRKEVADKREQKESFQEESNEAQKKLEAARKELRLAQDELSRVTKDVGTMSVKAKADVQKYEKEMVEIAQKKAMLESERIHVDAEAEKLKAYVEQIRTARLASAKGLEDSQSALMQSRLALDSGKTELTKAIADGQKSEFENKKVESRMRGLASAAEASDLLDGGRMFVTTKSCTAFRRPASQAQQAQQVEPGRKLLGRESVGTWVKLTSEGKSVYVDKSCGRFED